MDYFADLKGIPVIDGDHLEIGKLTDLIFLATENPSIRKIVVKRGKETLMISVKDILYWGKKIVVRKDFSRAAIEKNELSLKNQLLNKQIIDIGGNKVVRVNDVAIQRKPSLMISGVAIGLLSILRWFGVEDFFIKLTDFFNLNLTPHILPWSDIQPIELEKGKVVLQKEMEKMKRIHPADLADYLEETNIANVFNFLNKLNDDFVADIVDNLNINYQTALFKKFRPKKAARLIKFLDSDEAVDILLTLSPKRREKILNYLSEEEKEELVKLLRLSRTPIGELLSSEYFVVPQDLTAERVVRQIKKESLDGSYLSYIYVINNHDQLVGVFNLYELIIQKPTARVYRFMIPNVAVLHLTTPKEIALKKMLKYKLHAMPVIDVNKKILGVVTFDDLSEGLIEKL